MRFTGLFLFITFLGVLPAAAAQDLHLLIVSDEGDPELGEGFAVNKNRLADLLINNVAARNLKITDLYGQADRAQFEARRAANQAIFDRTGNWPTNPPANLTYDLLVQTIRSLPVDADDTLIVYLACHGYFDPKVGNYFAFAGAERGFSRQSIINEINARRPRLGGIISDACQEYARMELEETAQSPLDDELLVTSPLCQSLFFEHRGFLDWSAADEGEFAVYYNNYRTFLSVPPTLLKKNWAAASRSGPPRPDPPPGTAFTPEPYLFSWQFLRIRQLDRPDGDVVRTVQARGGIFTEALVAVAHDRMQQKLDWPQFHALVKQRTASEYRIEVPTGRIDVGGFEREQATQTVMLTSVPERVSSSTPKPKPPKPTPPKPDPPFPAPPANMQATGNLRVLIMNSSSQTCSVRLLDDQGAPASAMRLPPQTAWVAFAKQSQRWVADFDGLSNPLTGRVNGDNSTITLGSGITRANSYGATCYNRAGGEGVVVVQVVGNSPADRDKVRAGDVVKVANGTTVNDVAAYNAAVGRPGDRVSLLIHRNQIVSLPGGRFKVVEEEVMVGPRMTPPAPRPPTPKPPLPPTLPESENTTPAGPLQLTILNTTSGPAKVRLFDAAGNTAAEREVSAGMAAVLYGSTGQRWQVTAAGAAPHQEILRAPRYFYRIGPQPVPEQRLGAFVMADAGSKRVIIAHVAQGSVAWDNRFEPGDVVVSVNSREMTDPDSFRQAVAAAGSFARIVLERPKVVELADGTREAVPISVEVTVQLAN